MKQHGYLFIGGPLDQQWRDVPRADAVVVAVENATGPTTAQMVHYYRHIIFTSGWLVPIEVFSVDPMLSPEIGTPMPGWVEGQVPASQLVPPWRYLDDEGRVSSAFALNRAIKARGFRP